MSECVLCRPDLGPVVAESTYWRLVINFNQNYLGKCMWVLNRHCEHIADLLPPEWADLHPQIAKSRHVLTRAFSPDHFNHVFLQNQDRHVHMHIVPRYRSSRSFQGALFTDEEWPGHYNPDKAPCRLDETQMTALADLFRTLWAEG
jgi:diadenosine tetraphosphate (Ap4A) HIT family hydrolase